MTSSPLKIAFLSVQLTLMACLFAAADELRDKVADDGPKKPSPQLIDPNQSILGFKVGVAEDEVFAKLGKPDAYVRLNSENTAAIFNNSQAFIFTEGKLTGIRVGHSLIDHQLITQYRGTIFLQPLRWKLDNGIGPETSLVEARKILGDQLQATERHQAKYHQSYEDGESVIDLFFSHYVDQGDQDSAYRIHGILVRSKSE